MSHKPSYVQGYNDCLKHILAARRKKKRFTYTISFLLSWVETELALWGASDETTDPPMPRLEFVRDRKKAKPRAWDESALGVPNE